MVLLRDVFHIGLVIGQYEKHHVMIPLLINQSNVMLTI